MTAQDRSERRSDWLTAEQMAALCGVSVATVKRRCEDGKPIKCRDGTLVEIESERIARPQGWEWRVRAMTAPPALSTAQEQTDQEDAPALTSGDQALVMRSLGILETLLRANGDTFDRQSEQIARLQERAAKAEALAVAADRRAAEAERILSAAQERTTQAIVDHVRAEAERDSLAARLAAAEARAAEAERRARWWWPWWLPWRT